MQKSDKEKILSPSEVLEEIFPPKASFISLKKWEYQIIEYFQIVQPFTPFLEIGVLNWLKVSHHHFQGLREDDFKESGIGYNPTRIMRHARMVSDDYDFSKDPHVLQGKNEQK